MTATPLHTHRAVRLRVVRSEGGYADVPERRLATILAEEDLAEDRGLSPHDRITCRLHRKWVHHCISSPLHVIPLTGHRWCRDCRIATSVAVDELTGGVVLTCPRCGTRLAGRATRQIVRTCQASLAASRATRRLEEKVIA